MTDIPERISPDPVKDSLEQAIDAIQPLAVSVVESAEELMSIYLSSRGLLLLALLLGTGLLALAMTQPVRRMIERIWPSGEHVGRHGALPAIQKVVLPVLWSLGLWIATDILQGQGYHHELLRVAASLLNAWVLIRLFSTFVPDPSIGRVFALAAWVVAALHILRLLDPLTAMLSGVSMNIGEINLTLYAAIKAAIITGTLLWGSIIVSGFIQGRIRQTKSLTPSTQTLIGHGLRIGLMFMAVLLAMNAIGVDLTALAVFSGAIGIGVGFGLQAIFSNLMAGMILLFEGSLKVGHFVELDNGTIGEVREIGIRATRITTNDNLDILVPNSEFINNRVTNWTLREGYRRVHIPFRVAYGTDKDLVRTAALEAAATLPHELKGPAARPAEVWLVNFGESSLDFELVVWVSPEAVKRPSRVNADYNWAIETALGKYGIEIPFPQRDLHIRTGELPIRLEARRTSK